MIRLFIAIDLSQEIKDYLFTLKDEFKPDVLKIHWVAKSKLHLTLKFLGQVDDKEINNLITNMSEIKSNKFKLELNNLGVFPNKNYLRVFWMGLKNVKYVLELHGQIEDKLRKFFDRDKEFSCHITLGRIKSIKNKSEFLSKFNNFKVKNLSFDVDCFKLIKSELSKDGPKYTEIAKFNLL